MPPWLSMRGWRVFLDYMPGSVIPGIRQPFSQGNLLPFWSMKAAIEEHYLNVVPEDPGEAENGVGEPLESTMMDMLPGALTSVAVPEK
ncbi:MAG: hypothetical protein WD002_09930 [Pseudomonadales bacterium]